MIRRLILLAAVLLPPLGAQEAQTRQFSIRALAFQIQGKLPELFIHDLAAGPDASGLPIQLKSYLNHESQAIALSGAQVVFTTEKEGSSVNDKEKVIAKYTVPGDLRQGIMLFLPAPKDHPEPCRILSLDDSPRAFPAGSLNVVNLSPATVRITLEKNAFEFKAGERRLIKDPPAAEDQMMRMMAFSLQPDQNWKQFGANNWVHPGSSRSIQIVFENPRNGKMEIKGIKDVAVDDRTVQLP